MTIIYGNITNFMKQNKKKLFSSTQIINIARSAFLTNTSYLVSVVIIVQHIIELKQITDVFSYEIKISS